MIPPVKIDPFIFYCEVNTAGYEWAQGLDSQFRLVGRAVPGAGARIRVQEPRAGLFREFSQLRPTQNAIADFANQYGDIFGVYNPLSDSVIRHGPAEQGASFAAWKAEVGDMRVLVNVWADIDQENRANLEKIITWGDKSVGYSIDTPKLKAQKLLAHSDLPENQMSRFELHDVLMPARYALQYEINRRLADPKIVTVPQLAWTPDYRQRLIFRPSSLLAAMWLQFAQAVTGEFQLKKCEACGKYFQAGPGGKRADATTCSDACRQRKRRIAEMGK